VRQNDNPSPQPSGTQWKSLFRKNSGSSGYSGCFAGGRRQKDTFISCPARECKQFLVKFSNRRTASSLFLRGVFGSDSDSADDTWWWWYSLIHTPVFGLLCVFVVCYVFYFAVLFLFMRTLKKVLSNGRERQQQQPLRMIKQTQKQTGDTATTTTTVTRRAHAHHCQTKTKSGWWWGQGEEIRGGGSGLFVSLALARHWLWNTFDGPRQKKKKKGNNSWSRLKSRSSNNNEISNMQTITKKLQQLFRSQCW